MTNPPIQLPLPGEGRPPAFISFSAEIVPQTTESLIQAVSNFVNQGFRELHLLLSTPGGSVMHGTTVIWMGRGKIMLPDWQTA